MTKRNMPQLTAYMSNYFLDAGLLQLTTHSSKHLSSSVEAVATSRMGSFVFGLSSPKKVINVGPHHQPWLRLLRLLATQRPARLQHDCGSTDWTSATCTGTS